MRSAPIPSLEETSANQTFDALLWALSRPGLPRTLPAPGPQPIVEALLDRECRVHASDPLLLPAVVRTGAHLVDLDAADHVFLNEITPEQMKALRQGSDLYPDDGATLVLPVRIGTGQRLRLSGPGVEGTLEVSIAGLSEGFWDMRARIMRYPQGFEVFFHDGPTVIGVPRSTQVEVL